MAYSEFGEAGWLDRGDPNPEFTRDEVVHDTRDTLWLDDIWPSCSFVEHDVVDLGMEVRNLRSVLNIQDRDNAEISIFWKPGHGDRIRVTGNLEWIDLSGYVFPEKMLFFQANLSGSNLQGARLYRAKMWEVDLSWANLQDADLRRLRQSAGERDLNLQGANLRNADLAYADLRWANLSEADLTGAKLDNVMFMNISWEELAGMRISRSSLEAAKDGVYFMDFPSFTKEWFSRDSGNLDKLYDLLSKAGAILIDD